MSGHGTSRHPAHRRGLVLAPGASATRDHPSLVAIERALSGDDVVVERIDLPKTAARAVGVMRSAAEALTDRAGIPQAHVALGGRSFGGRMGSMAVGDGLPALGLALVSYPLHPPGKPDVLRTEHFPALAVPCLFVSGTRDAFATPDELAVAVEAIAGPVTIVPVDGGDHGLRGRDELVAGVVRDWLLGLAVPPG